MLTVAVAVAIWPLASVTVNDSRNVPLVISVTVWGPVPMNGAVPPEAVTSQVKGLPVVSSEVGQVTVATSGCEFTLTVAVPDAVPLLASVTVNNSVFAPLVASVRLNEPVPLYGAVPPLASTVHLNGFPTVTSMLGHVAVTIRG